VNGVTCKQGSKYFNEIQGWELRKEAIEQNQEAPRQPAVTKKRNQTSFLLTAP
jgi:hypothetical protein